MTLKDETKAKIYEMMNLDDGSSVPVVIVSRYRLAQRVASLYGCETFLVVDEGQPSLYDKYEIHVRAGDASLYVTWKVSNPRSFHRGLSALHEFLEQNRPLGKTLGEVLITGEVCGRGPPGPSVLEQVDG